MMNNKSIKMNGNVPRKRKKRTKGREIWHRLLKNKGSVLGLIMIAVVVIVALLAGVIYDYDTDVAKSNVSQRLQRPSKEHPLGTDQLGRDLLARILYGARYSLFVGVIVVAVALTGGVIIGSIAGYYRKFDNVIMRVVDIIGAIPNLLLAVIIVAALGTSIVNLMLALGIGGISGYVRTTRASVLTVCSNDYIEASRAIGARDWWIILKHVLPNAFSPLIVRSTITLGGAVISASSMSFLGLGVPPPAPEWGNMLSTARSYIRSDGYLTIYPGLAIVYTVLAFNLIGDGLRDALDPKLKR